MSPGPGRSAIQAVDRGALRVGDRRGLLVTLDVIGSIWFSLEASMGEAAAAVFYNAGIIHGRNLVRSIREGWGGEPVSDPETMVREVLDYLANCGWGLLDVKELDLRERRVRLESRNLAGADYHRSIRSKARRPVDNLSRGLVVGAASEAWGDDLEGVETRCRALGAESCEFVVARPSTLREGPRRG